MKPAARIVAAFSDPPALGAAIAALRRAGCARIEAFAPYPLPDIEALLGERPSRLPRWCLVAGLLGAALGYGVQWWCLTRGYPTDVGGFEAHTGAALVPIAFESGILAAAFTAFVGALVGSGLPRLWHPAFAAEGFSRASADGFFLAVAIESGDEQRVRAALQPLAALTVERVEA